MKKLAVIIPIYLNDKFAFLKKSIDSILSQTIKDFHLILALDGPVKEKVVNYFKTLPDNVEIIKYDKNKGLATTLNNSIKYAKEYGFEYIARMDADDIALPNRFEKQVLYLDNNPEVYALGTQAYVIDSNDEIIGIKNAASRLVLRVLKKSSDIIHPSVVFRAEFFDKVGYYIVDVPPAEDYDLWFRAAKSEVRVESLSERLFYFRYDGKIIERRQNAQKHVLKIKKKHLQYFEYHHLIPHYFIRITPKFILKSILYRSIKP